MLRRKGSPFVTLLILGAAVGDGFANRDRAEHQHALLLELLHEIPKPIQTSLLEDADWGFSFWRPHDITVGSDFQTRLPPPGLLVHYNEQMRLRGWQFEHPTVVKDWGRDEGMRRQVYRKGEMEACLTYGADQRYIFSLHWEESIWASLRHLFGQAGTP